MPPYEYAKMAYLSGVFPAMNVMNVAGRFLICDNDWNFLKTKVSYSSSEEARKAISAAIEKASKFI